MHKNPVEKAARFVFSFSLDGPILGFFWLQSWETQELPLGPDGVRPI